MSTAAISRLQPCSNSRSCATPAIARLAAATTGTLLSASSFYDRFTATLVVFLQQACQRALGQLTGVGPGLQGALSAFEDLLITDATVLRLHDLLHSTYAACRTNHTQADFSGAAVPSADGFRTPLGVAKVDAKAVAALRAADPAVAVNAAVHQREHSIEVQVPFAQVALPHVPILPVVVSSEDPAFCARFGRTLARALKGRR